MAKVTSGSDHRFTDTATFVGVVNGAHKNLPAEIADLFRPGEIIISRAPGRLDLMGGIADYSGSLVLELPIALATHVAVQIRSDSRLRIVSLPANSGGSIRIFESDLAELLSADDYSAARRRFAADPQHSWAAYVAGAFLILKREKHWVFNRGATLLVSSSVPEGKGVSSSAALEVAAMQAITAAYEYRIQPDELALLCQKVENLIAGAPCGVMDQMTSACGEADRLLMILCQPGEIKGHVDVPAGVAVWGVDSGIRHSVGGADYGTVRTAAFMGYRIIANLSKLPCEKTNKPGAVRIEDNKWHGYLANITPAEFERDFAKDLPERMNGAEFLKRYEGITDPVTSVKPNTDYPILQATKHPIYEHARVNAFANELTKGATSTSILGDLMYQSHDSYSACGLGSSGTEEIVRLVQNAGENMGLYGAKITGGGSGGTVAVLGRREAEPSVNAIVKQYTQLTGHRPTVLLGSSAGAGSFGHLRIRKDL